MTQTEQSVVTEQILADIIREANETPATLPEPYWSAAAGIWTDRLEPRRSEVRKAA